MKRTNSARFFIFAVLLVAAAASAHSEMLVQEPATETFIVNVYEPVTDFTVSGQTQLDMCRCELTAFPITVKNTGNLRNNYQVASDSEYSRFYPENFTLSPGESFDITNIVSIPCSLQKGFDVRFSISTDTGISRGYAASVSVRDCNNLNARMVSGNMTIQPCEQANLTLGLSNTGSFSEIYDLAVLNFTGIATYPESVLIYPRQSSLINIGLQPSCNISGRITPSLAINTRNSRLATSVQGDINILPRYEFTATADDNAEVCAGKEKTIQLRIMNRANFTNRYEISSDQPWITSSLANITLGPRESISVNISVNPKEAGRYEASLIVTPLYGPSAHAEKVQIISDDCYSYTVSLPGANFCPDDSLYLTIANKGLLNDTYALKVLSPENASLGKDQVSIPSGGESRIPVSISDSSSEQISIRLLVSSAGLGSSEEKALSAKMVSAADCYRPVISEDRIYFSHKNETRSFVISNKGTKKSGYAVSAEQRGWLSILKSDFTLSPGESASVPIYLSADASMPEGSYSLPVTVLSTDNNQTYTKTITFILADYNLSTFILHYKCVIIEAILLLAVLLLFIKCLADFNHRERLHGDLMWLIILVILALIPATVCFQTFATMLGFTYQGGVNQTANSCAAMVSNESICTSKFYVRWNEDTVDTLNLKSYINDPDADNLTFSSNGTAHIKAWISGSTVKLYPAKDWYGIETARFTAEDNRGGSISSPEFYLHVLDVEEFSLKNFLLVYYGYIFSALGLVLICIAIYLALTAKRE